MLSSLVLCLASAGWLDADLLQQPHKSIPGLPRVDLCEHLESNRRAIAIVESAIELCEADLKELPNTPERAGKLRRELDEMRGHLQFLKRYEQALEWGMRQRKLNPGPETDREAISRREKVTKEWKTWRDAWDRGLIAPMPREVQK